MVDLAWARALQLLLRGKKSSLGRKGGILLLNIKELLKEKGAEVETTFNSATTGSSWLVAVAGVALSTQSLVALRALSLVAHLALRLLPKGRHNHVEVRPSALSTAIVSESRAAHESL